MTRGAARSVRSSSRFDHGFIGRSRSFTILAIGEHRVDRDCDLHRTDGVATRWHDGIFIEQATKEHQRDHGAIAIGQPRCSPSFLSPWRRIWMVGSSSNGRHHEEHNDKLFARSGPPNLPDQIGRQRFCWTHDRGSRLRFDRGLIAPRLGLIYRQIGAESSWD